MELSAVGHLNDDAERLTRQQLYELAWEKPMSEIAEKYGYSDVALAKMCRKAEIPVPPRGYWAKLRAGKSVSPRPVLPVGDGSGRTWVVSRRPKPDWDEMIRLRSFSGT